MFAELSIIIVIATVVSVIMRLLRQPLVVGYILTGVIVGPYALHLLSSTEYIELFSKIGIAILLFIVGLSLNPTVIREVGKTAAVTGIGQVLFTSLIGFFLVRWMGFAITTSLYIAMALTFSSTIIILKLLSDKGDLGKLYGKISIGFLLVQDLIATVILVVVSTFAIAAGNDAGSVLLQLLLKGALAGAVVFLVARFVLPRMSNFFAASQELLFVFSIAWGLGLAAFFAYLGFSVEIGALVAGVAFSLSPFSYEVGSRVKPLRDFFILLFFILLGYQMTVSDIASLIKPALGLSAFVLIGNPLIVLLLMNLLGFKRKTGFLAGLTVAQISEFSLILMALGFSFGHVTSEAVSLVTLIGIVTITMSTYFILYGEAIYAFLEPVLKIFDMEWKKKHEHASTFHPPEAIIFGYDRVGSDFVAAAEKLGAGYLVVDFNPESIKKLQEKNIPFRYGDAEDVEFLSEINVHDAKLVISTIPDFEANLVLTKAYRKRNADGIIMVLSHDVQHAKDLYLAGASYVVMPHYLGAHYAAHMVEKHGFDVSEFDRERNIHLTRLAKRDSR
ncbi:MAG: potassium efflux system protein [Candidatus Campbellbacteria bacterium]